MIVGNGDIASVLTPKAGVIYFASGVSNSNEIRESEFEREYQLLIRQNSTSRIVYFSTLSIYYKDTPYTRHKKRMEGAVKTNFRKYCIVRLGNITWGKNPNTLLNFLKANPNAERRNEYRYLIDEDYFLHWINMIPNFNTEMNLTGTIINVKDL